MKSTKETQPTISFWFRLSDILRISARQALRQYKLYLGVIAAIAFGTAGVIIILTMGEEVKNNLNNDLTLLGGATIIKAQFSDPLTAEEMSTRRQWFHEETVEAVRGVTGVADAGLMTRVVAHTVMETRTIQVVVLGVDQHFWNVNQLIPIAGELYGPQANEDRALVCVLGEELAQDIFGRTDVVGERLPINQSMYEVVGMLGGDAAKGLTKFAFIPLNTSLQRLSVQPSKIYIRSATWDDVDIIAETLPQVIREAQSVERLELDVSWDALEQVKRIVWWVELFVYFSVAATLVLGGYGILNGVMNAVSSRTREIGLKKAMGAEDMDILMQFLTEATCLSILSAVFGVAFGRLGVELACYMLGTRPPEDLFFISSGMSLVFSLVLGVGAGFYPSLKASRMELVSAIRYE
ncbi:MAG: ABC transporter permease [Desulfovibrio sp.]|nr:MAG: ABC transporter permease [Desulfovibrio sp.]